MNVTPQLSTLSFSSGESPIVLPAIDLETPFENIALAFSGGGYRAAAYSLGVLSMLGNIKFPDHTQADKEVPLLTKVKYISSASGGSFTNSLYALYQAEGKDMNELYHDLIILLQEDKLLGQALSKLNDRKIWKQNKSKKRNIINAFALTYDSSLLFNGKTIGSLKNSCSPHLHLEEVCFNATEFYRGLSFRQQIKLKTTLPTDPYFYYGNHYVQFDHIEAEKLKIADVLAASSCFPAGFEPLIFPEDFCYNGIKVDDLKNSFHINSQTGSTKEKEFIEKKRVGLMDGGVADNQGLESLMLADKRRREFLCKDPKECNEGFKPFDFIMVNDVGSFYMDGYEAPAKKSKFGLSLLTILIIGVLMAGGGWKLSYYFFSPVPSWLIAACTVFSFFLSVAVLLTGYLYYVLHNQKGKSALNLEKSFSKEIVNTLFWDLFKAPLNMLFNLINIRIKSVLMLNNDVFLKRIRQLIYNSFYDSALWKNRSKGNHIYDLSFATFHQRGDRDTVDNISSQVHIVAQRAANMGTSLWFTEENRKNKDLECLIACGQFTTCYNLLDYINKLEAKPIKFSVQYTKRLEELKKALEECFIALNEDPFHLYNILGRNLFPGFVDIDCSDIKKPDF